MPLWKLGESLLQFSFRQASAIQRPRKHVRLDIDPDNAHPEVPVYAFASFCVTQAFKDTPSRAASMARRRWRELLTRTLNRPEKSR